MFKWKLKLKLLFLLLELGNWIKFRELLNLASATVTNGGSRGKSEVENQSRFSRNSHPRKTFLSFFLQFSKYTHFLWHLLFLGNSRPSHPWNSFISFFNSSLICNFQHTYCLRHSIFLVKNVICLETLFHQQDDIAFLVEKLFNKKENCTGLLCADLLKLQLPTKFRFWF